jgi:hypothetical protein
MPCIRFKHASRLHAPQIDGRGHYRSYRLLVHRKTPVFDGIFVFWSRLDMSHDVFVYWCGLRRVQFHDMFHENILTVCFTRTNLFDMFHDMFVYLSGLRREPGH